MSNIIVSAAVCCDYEHMRKAYILANNNNFTLYNAANAISVMQSWVYYREFIGLFCIQAGIFASIR